MTVPGRVTSIRRYPVKSMGGEALDRARLDRRGIVGDRWYAVEDGDGHFASGKNTRRFRRRDAVFAYSAQTDSDGVVRVARGRHGWTVGDSLLDQHMSTHMRAAVRVTAEASIPHQDLGAVSIIGTATLDWCAATWGGDSDWRRLRCRMIDIAQDGVSPQTKWLKKVSNDRGMFLAVYADVRKAGEFAVGDLVGATAGRP